MCVYWFTCRTKIQSNERYIRVLNNVWFSHIPNCVNFDEHIVTLYLMWFTLVNMVLSNVLLRRHEHFYITKVIDYCETVFLVWFISFLGKEVWQCRNYRSFIKRQSSFYIWQVLCRSGYTVNAAVSMLIQRYADSLMPSTRRIRGRVIIKKHFVYDGRAI